MSMKIICPKSLILLTLFAVLISCGNDKENTKAETNSVKETSEDSSKKKEKIDKTTTVKVEAKIDGKNIIFDKNDPKYNSVVVLFNEAIQLKFTDMNNQTVMVHLYDAKIYESSPISFTQQIASLPRKEQVLVKVKGSKLSISNTSNDERKIVSISELIEGDVILKEFTDDKILISFKGQGFLVGANNSKDNLFAMEGEITVENYSIYDGR